MITRVDAFDYANEFAIHCVGIDDLIRGHQSVFLSQLDTIEPVDPAKTRLIKDESNGYKLSKLFLEAQLRQVPATGIEPDLDVMGVFRRMNFQEETVRWALCQSRGYKEIWMYVNTDAAAPAEKLEEIVQSGRHTRRFSTQLHVLYRYRFKSNTNNINFR